MRLRRVLIVFLSSSSLLQLKSSSGSSRLAGLCALRQQLPTPPVTIGTDLQQPLINALLHLLHERPDSDAPVTTPAADGPTAALACLEHIFAHPTILTAARFSVLVRKMHELSLVSPSLSALLAGGSEGLRATLAAHAQSTTGSASANESAASDEAARLERKQRRAAKEARKQADATQKRKEKADAEAKQHAQQQADTHMATAQPVAPESSAFGGLSASFASLTLPDLPSSSVVDGGESAPFGNFHTYYRFHPPEDRLKFVPPQLAAWAMHDQRRRGEVTPIDGRFTFLDIGCNEGDLTIGLLRHLLAGLRGEANEPPVVERPETDVDMADATSASSPPSPFVPSSLTSRPFVGTHVHGIGVDIDPLLIERAQAKSPASLDALRAVLAQEDGATPLTPTPALTFDTIDVMQPDALDKILELASKFAPSSNNNASSTSSLPTPPPIDLVCCYSVTMWVHLHHGDEGLQRLLRCLSGITSQLILEPQPWRCYRTARERWRRSGKADPPMMSQLAWRTDVEDRIVEFVTKHCGMRVKAELGTNQWNRRVIWCERR